MLDYNSPDITLDDIVFEGRNKEYGAYELRKNYGKIVTRAALISVLFLLLVLFGPLIVKALTPEPEIAEEELTVTPTKLAPPPPLDPKTPPPPPPPASAPPPPKVTTVRFVEPEVAKDEEVVEEPPKMEKLKDAQTSDQSVQGDPNADPNEIVVEGSPGGTGEVAAAPVDDQVYTTADIEEYPGFPGGDDAMAKFLRNNIKYPPAAIRAEKQGKVYVEIMVEKNGQISDVKVVRGIGFGLDEEAVRAVKVMPAWTPGKYNGNSVRVRMSIPINFRLTSE